MKLIRKPIAEEEKKSNFAGFVFRIIPYWPLFLILILVSVAAAWLYLAVTTPMYETNAQILFRDDKKDGQDDKTIESLDLISPKRSVDNEIEVVQSKEIINNVINDLYLYAPVFESHSLRNVSAYNSSPILVTTNDVQSLNYRAGKKVPFSLQGNNVVIGTTRYPLDKLLITPFGNLKFIKNPHRTDLDSEGSEFFFSLVVPKKAASTISKNLKVDVLNKQSTILNIKLLDENQDKGEAIVNTIIKEYNISVQNEKNQLAANTDKFIDDRLKIVENDMLNIEHQQQSYKASNGAIDIDTQGKLFLENVSANDQKVSEINLQLSVLDRIGQYVKSKSASNGIVPSTVGVDDPGLTEMVKNIYELQLEVESLKKTTGENNPIVVADQDKINKIRPQILENLENQRQSLQATKNSLSSTNKTYSSALQTMPENQKTLVDINRELNLKSGVYTYLLQKKEETELSFITNSVGSKIVDKAESSEFPVSPKGKIIYLASFLLALIAGAVIVSARESTRSNILYQEEIENLTELPVISEITSGEAEKPIVIGHNQRSLIAEQFRRLRTTLGTLGVGGDKKKVLITSGIPGEGKSFVALNLALSVALAGKKVILVDFDLNNPTLHTKLQIKRGQGVSDYLETPALQPEAIVNRTDLSENLSFISAGRIPENPSELIVGERTEELLNWMDQNYDFIVVDVAPVGPISDAYILSPLCDATLYIVRHGFTPKAFVERIDKQNKVNTLNNAAIVFNDVSSRSFKNYGYGYGYNYGYNYGKDNNNRLDKTAS